MPRSIKGSDGSGAAALANSKGSPAGTGMGAATVRVIPGITARASGNSHNA
jgi:hypothetical protein